MINLVKRFFYDVNVSIFCFGDMKYWVFGWINGYL